MLVCDADVDFSVVRIEDIAASTRTSQEVFHGFIDVLIDRLASVAGRIVRTEAVSVDDVCRILLTAGERVAHVWFEPVGSPMAKEAIGAHAFGMELSSQVVVECDFVYPSFGSSLVDEG